MNRELKLLRGDRAGPNPAPIERLLCERIVSTWLHQHHPEMIYARKDRTALELAFHYQRCIDRAHQRYLSAIKSLVVVRKLAVPVLHFNIGAVGSTGPARVASPTEATSD